MIDVIIPDFKSFDNIFNLLSSISYQSIADKINVFIVCDSSTNCLDIVNIFNNYLNINVIKCSNDERELRLKKAFLISSSPYVLFINECDCILNSLSFEKLLYCIENNNADVVIGNYVVKDLKNRFKLKSKDEISFCGKLYRRSFILDNDIFFKYNDNVFNYQLLLCNPILAFLNFDVLISNENKKIDCNNDIFLKKYVKGVIFIIEYSKERFCDNYKYAKFILSSLVYIYYFYLINNDHIKLSKVSNELKKIVYENDIYYKYLKKEDVTKILKSEFDRAYKKEICDVICLQKIKYQDFLKMIKNF